MGRRRLLFRPGESIEEGRLKAAPTYPHTLRRPPKGRPYVLTLPVGSGRRRARNCFAEDLDRAEVNVAAGPVAAARHQIREADLIDLREIRIDDPDFVVRICRARAAA